MRIMHIVTCLFIALAAWSQYQLCDCQHAVAAAETRQVVMALRSFRSRPLSIRTWP